MKKITFSAIAAAALLTGALSAHAAGWGDALRDQLGGGAAAESSGAA